MLSVRLAAFASLGIVAGLMVQNSIDARQRSLVLAWFSAIFLHFSAVFGNFRTKVHASEPALGPEDHLFGMSKRMSYTPKDLDGFLQLIAFLLLIVVQFLNVIATYVGVAQPYHTIRLMTAGPSGFEASACAPVLKDARSLLISGQKRSKHVESMAKPHSF